jgi:MarR family transcriptional regulator, organic hydroperoxide resistance regulator
MSHFDEQSAGAGAVARKAHTSAPGIDGEISRTIEGQLCFAIYAASRAVTTLYRPMLERLGLTYPQYLVLLSLWERDDVLVRDLGTSLQLDYGTLSPLLKRMELAGLLRRERSSTDERSVRVMLTDRGRELDACAESVPVAVIRGMGLELSTLYQLRDVLHGLTENVAMATVGSTKAGAPSRAVTK